MKATTKAFGDFGYRTRGRHIKKATTSFLVFLIVFSSLSTLSFIVTNAQAATGTWTTEAALPEGRADLPGVTYNNKLYVFGGYQIAGGGGRPEVYAYDPSTNSWTEKASMTYARWGSAAALYNGKAYVFGGDDEANDNKVEAYDFAADSWVTKNNLPTNLAGQGQMAVTVGPSIYLFSTTFAYSYNPSTDTYTQLANNPISERWGECAYVNVGGEDRIYIMGGADDSTGQSTNTVYYYRPARNDWTYAGTTPYYAYGTLRDNPVIDGLIYFGFGHDDSVFFTDLFSYDPNTGTWSSALPHGTYPRDGLACGVIGGKLYAVGGRNAMDYPILGLDYNEQYDPGLALTASISPTQVRMYLGQSQTFSSSVSGGTPPYTYQWYRNGTAVSGATSPTWTFTPTQTGHYNIYLRVTDSLNNIAQSNTVSDILVYIQLSVSISPTSANITLGGSQTFTSTVTGGVPPNSYQWVLNGTAVSGATNPTWTFTPTQTGHYNIYVNVTDSLNNKAKSNTVTNILVYNQLSVSINPTSANITLGGSQTFNSTITGGIPPYTYQWYSNNTAVPGATSPTWTFTPNSTGTYKIYLNVTDSYVNVAQSNNATANVNSQLAVTVSPSHVKLYYGESQTFSSSVSGGTPPYSYQWVLNGTAVQGATNPTWTFTPTQTGHYNIYLNVTDSQNNKAQSNTITDINVYSVNLLLTPGPNQATYKKQQPVTITVNVFNQLNPSLQSTLTITVTGPNGYYFYDFQPINVAANGVEEYSFDWGVPNVAGTYVVETSLAPTLLTAYDTVWLKVA